MIIQPSKHSKELAGAIAEDQRRQAIDAAKKRAVSQQADYDTFKKLVSVAHLKPLSAPSSTAAGASLPAWKLDATGVLTAATTAASQDAAAAGRAATGCLCSSSSSTDSTSARPAAVPPQTSHEFMRHWRKECNTAEAKYRLVKLCGSELMASLFKVEITGELLGQLLLVLQEEWVRGQQLSPACAAGRETEAMSQQAVFLVQLLHSLTGAGRFELNARLISSKAKHAADQLCWSLAAFLQQQQQQQGCCGQAVPPAAGTALPGHHALGQQLAGLEMQAEGKKNGDNQGEDELLRKLQHVRAKLQLTQLH